LESLHITNGLEAEGKYQVGNSAESIGKLLTTLAGFPTALKSIGFERLSSEFPYADGLQLSKHIISILEQHKSSIKKLFLDGCILEFNHLESIVFPSLKELSLVASGEDVSTVATFLSKLLPLETLSLKLEGRTASGVPLFSLLRTHGTHLKKFSLTWQLFATLVQADGAAHDDNWDSDDSNDDPPPNPVAPQQPVDALRDFSILKDFGSLQELKVHQFADMPIYFHQRDPRCSPGQILSSLPGLNQSSKM